MNVDNTGSCFGAKTETRDDSLSHQSFIFVRCPVRDCDSISQRLYFCFFDTIILIEIVLCRGFVGRCYVHIDSRCFVDFLEFFESNAKGQTHLPDDQNRPNSARTVVDCPWAKADRLTRNMSGLKYHMSVPVALGVLLVGLPYSVSIAVQWIYGWPNKPGYKKYIEALKPRRIYSLTRAVLETLKYLQYGRLYIQWRSWYNNNRNWEQFEKGITFGRRSNKLDLYYPPHESKTDDMLAPLVVFIYGGAWGSGDRTMYCLLAKQMAKEMNATVICPDYCIYPKGNVLGMVQDIADCLVWAQENGEKFNCDKDNIVLIGHSAGAHLCTLTTLFLIDARDELFIDHSKQKDITCAIRGVIGLSGVYNILDHYKHEQKRAIEYISCMHKAMNGEENFEYYSPIHVLKKLNQDQLSRVPPFALLHGTSDVIVPVESSTKFSELLNSLSVKVSLFLLPKVNHTEIVTDIMAPDRCFYQLIYSCVKQEFRRLQGTC